MSRMRSPVTSRSNCAKDSIMLSVSRPMGSVVLNDWVMETKVTSAAFESLDQFEKIEHRPGKPVDLVDNDDVDLAGFDICEQSLERRALQGAAGYAAVVIAVGDQHPAFRALAGDVGLAGLSLGVQRVELHVEAFLAGFAGVDRATQFPHWRHGRADDSSHRWSPSRWLHAALAVELAAAGCHDSPG